MRLWMEKIDWLPPAVGGLFAGRWAAFATALLLDRRAVMAPAPLLLLLALLCPAVGLLLWHRSGRPPVRRLWPLLLALPYLLLPAEAPLTALGAIAVVCLAFLIDRGRLDGAPGRYLPAIGVVTGALLLYGATLMPGVLPADNGEFQMRAAQLGVAHPTGFALYTMSAHLITRLPLPLTAAAAVNAYSLLLATATLLLVYATAVTLSRSRRAGVLAAAALGGSTTFWAQATTANIRMPTALLAAAAFYLLIRWTRQQEPLTAPQLLLFGALMTVSVTHHVSLGFMGIIFGIYVLTRDRTLLRPDRRWATAVGGAALGFLPLLYFPLRAGAPGAPADIDTMAGFLNHVLGLGFRGDLFYFRTPAELWDRGQIMANILAFQFSPLLLLGAVLGGILLVWGKDERRHRPVALLLLTTFAAHTVITATYRAPQTVEYMLPAYIPVALALGHAATLRRPRPVGIGVAALLLTVAAGQIWARYPSYLLLSQQNDAGDYTNSILDQAPPDSVVLAGWHWATPLWYRQEIEGLRPDLDVRYVFPTGEPYADTWVRRIGEALAENRPVIATHRFPTAYGALPAPVPLGEALLFPTGAAGLPEAMTPLEIALGDAVDRVAIRGFQVTASQIGAGDTLTVEIAWEPLRPLPAPASLFVHLVDRQGQLAAQSDVSAVPRPDGVTVTRLTVTPRPGTMPGDYALLAGAYLVDGDDITQLTAAGGEVRVPLTRLNVTTGERAPFTAHPTYRPLINDERILIGYDWDNTSPDVPRLYLHWETSRGYVSTIHDAPAGRFSLPPWRAAAGWPRRGTVLENDGGYYVPFGQGIVWTGPLLSGDDAIAPGEDVILRHWFHANRPVVRDIAVSLRLVGYEPDRFTWDWAVLDEEFGVPAMGAVPTLKWIDGMRVLDLHRLPVPEAAEAGQESGVLLNLYDVFTNRPVPIMDERFTPATPWRTPTVEP